MIKTAILTLGMLAIATAGFAQNRQPCASDEFYREQKAIYPGIAAQEAQLKADIDRYISGRLNNPRAKTTAGVADTPWVFDTYQFQIPVVVHIIYDNASSARYISDNDVYGMIERLSTYYNKTNDLSGIIKPFVPYEGDGHISFHLASKSPQGNPTRGITRHYSSHAPGGDELAKIGGWAPDQYLNIWLENIIGRGATKGTVLAYATFPTSYADNPYSQGVISRGDQALASPSFGDVTTVPHEVGHFFSLYHPWNSNSQEVEGSICGDDEVDDTPPTVGHFSCSFAKLYDTVCAKGYTKAYDSVGYYLRTGIKASAGTIDYPDTTNTQNIMDYSACNNQMFTKGQVARMRATLRSNVGFRSHLADTSNLIQTGVWDASYNFVAPKDIAPTADFIVNRPFVCADGNTNLIFTNRSYNDTLSDAEWTFTNNATTPNTTTLNPSVTNAFSEPGWVNISLKATSNAGSNMIAKKNLVYAAETSARNPMGYYQEFNHGTASDSIETSKYPIFNYFGTDHKWELVNNAGVFDNTSIRYANFDARLSDDISNTTQSPWGDYADFYTPAFNLSGFGGLCNLDFFSAGAFRTNKPKEMNDTLEIAVSNDCGVSWRVIDKLNGGRIANNGYRADRFSPIWSEWKEQSISIPAPYRTDKTYLRFRFKAGVANPALAILGIFPANFGLGTGNNFYLDRLSISNAPLGVKNGVIVKLDMSVAPNPTSGAATVSLNGGDNSVADLTVTDVTGKLVYSSSVARTAATTKVEIPAAAIAVKGMYLVKVVTNGATETQKLVVY